MSSGKKSNQPDTLLSLGGLTNIRERINEVTQNFSWHHDGITVSRYFLCDLYHLASRIFLQIKVEGLTISENFFSMQQVIVPHGFFLVKIG